MLFYPTERFNFFRIQEECIQVESVSKRIYSVDYIIKREINSVDIIRFCFWGRLNLKNSSAGLNI